MALISSDRTSLLQLSHKADTVLGFRVHRMLQAEFLQAAQVMVYDYYEPCEHGPGGGGVSREGTGPEKDWARRKGRREGRGQKGGTGRGRGGPWLRGRGGQEGAGRDPRGVVMRGVAFLGGYSGPAGPGSGCGRAEKGFGVARWVRVGKKGAGSLKRRDLLRGWLGWSGGAGPAGGGARRAPSPQEHWPKPTPVTRLLSQPGGAAPSTTCPQSALP